MLRRSIPRDFQIPGWICIDVNLHAHYTANICRERVASVTPRASSSVADPCVTLPAQRHRCAIASESCAAGEVKIRCKLRRKHAAVPENEPLAAVVTDGEAAIPTMRTIS